MQIKKPFQELLVQSLLGSDPGSPILLEGYNFEHIQNLVKQFCITDSAEPLLLVSAESGDGIEGVRQIVSRLHKKGVARRFVLFEKAHLLRKEALNALLKLLEEPPLDTHIVLTTLPYAVLPTIRSRCSIVKFFDTPEKHAGDFEVNIHASSWFSKLGEVSTQDALKLLSAFLEKARADLLQEKRADVAQKKAQALFETLEVLNKGVYSKIAFQNIFVNWKYA